MSHDRVYLDYFKDMLEGAEKAIAFIGDMGFEHFQ